MGDAFIESYTYGPVGVTTRTVETEDADPGDNFDHWVLPDVLGGSTGLLAKVGTGAREPVFQHFDAFGVRVGVDSTWSADYDASRYRWRSQEGSETDDLAVSDNYGAGLQPPTLVYMQTRHYDPALGRFIMADSIPMGAFSPQGLNRYAYCTNDPVNGTDPLGRFNVLSGILLGAMFSLGAYLGYELGKALGATPTLLGGAIAAFSGGVGSGVAGHCLSLAQKQSLELLSRFLALGSISGATYMSSLASTISRPIWIAFGLGLMFGMMMSPL